MRNKPLEIIIRQKMSRLAEWMNVFFTKPDLIDAKESLRNFYKDGKIGDNQWRLSKNIEGEGDGVRMEVRFTYYTKGE